MFYIQSWMSSLNWVSLQDLVSLGIALGVVKMSNLVNLERECKSQLARYAKRKQRDEDIEIEKMQTREAFVRKMRKAIEDVIIRRTVKSKCLDEASIGELHSSVVCVIDVNMCIEEKTLFESIKQTINDQL